MRLGKIVQGILNIFKKKKHYERGLRAKCNLLEDSAFIGKEVILNDGELFINGEPFGKVLKVEKLDLPDNFFEKTNVPAELKRDLIWDGSITLEEELNSDTANLLKILANSPKQVLPKVIKVPTLIVSAYTNWGYDSIGVDISQLAEKGIAHFFCTSTKSEEEYREEFLAKYPEAEEEYADCTNAIVRDAILLQWESGEWEWVC